MARAAWPEPEERDALTVRVAKTECCETGGRAGTVRWWPTIRLAQRDGLQTAGTRRTYGWRSTGDQGSSGRTLTFSEREPLARGAG